jgi:hypothetical protein
MLKGLCFYRKVNVLGSHAHDFITDTTAYLKESDTHGLTSLNLYGLSPGNPAIMPKVQSYVLDNYHPGNVVTLFACQHLALLST